MWKELVGSVVVAVKNGNQKSNYQRRNKDFTASSMTIMHLAEVNRIVHQYR